MSVRAMLAATPLPVATAPEALIAEFTQIAAARQGVLAAMEPAPLADDDHEVLAELHAREAVWADALTRARDSVQTQRIATTKLKTYTANL